MNDLSRLLESSRNPRTRALLQAARRDAPSRGSAERVLLGLAAAAAATAAGTVAAKAASVASGGTSALGGVGQGLALTTLKWLAVGAVSGGLLSAGAIAIQPSESRVTAPRAAAITPRAGGNEGAPRTVAVGAAEVSPPPASAAFAADPLPLPARGGEERSTAPTTAAPSDQGKLEREVRWIDAARRALAAGDSARALAELDHYDRLVETRILDREATVLRIEALLERGDDRRARQLFDAYVAQYPGDAHITRLRAHWGSIRE